MLKGLEATVLNPQGDLSISANLAERVDIVLADMDCKSPTHDRQHLVDHVTRCMIEGCRHQYVHAWAHPFNVGALAIPLRPLDFPEHRLREIAQAFAATNTAFNIVNPMHL